MQGKRVVLIGLTLGTLVLVPSPAARASFPGHNGLVAWQATSDAGYSVIDAVYANGERWRQISADPGTDNDGPRWSPDGRWVAFDRSWNTDTGPGWGVFVARPDGSRLHMVIGKNGSVGWTADGRILLLSGGTYSPYTLWSIRKDGTHRRKLMTRNAGNFYPYLLDASARGNWFAFSSRRSALAIVHLDGTGRRSLIVNDSDRYYIRPLDWSPDGKWILYERTTPTIGTRPPTADLYAIRITDRTIRRITFTPHQAETEESAAWSPDGRTIAFSTGSRSYLCSAGGGPPRRFPAADGAFHMDWERRPG